MAPTHVQLFGGFTITSGDGALPLLTRTRHQAFLAYLLLHCRQPHPRALLAAHFWPDSSDQQANKNLRVLLVEVRQVWPTLDHFVQIERATLCWQPAQPITVDLLAFETALQNATVAQQRGDEEGQLAAYGCVLAAYRGPLLPHLYDEWVQAARTTFSDQYKTTLTQLTLLYQQQGRLLEATQTAQRLQQYEPLSDVACRLLLDCYPLLGETTRALHAYQSYATALQRELGVDPEAELQARYGELLRRQHQPPSYPAAPPQ